MMKKILKVIFRLFSFSQDFKLFLKTTELNNQLFSSAFIGELIVKMNGTRYLSKICI
jgi:hypothetical protein